MTRAKFVTPVDINSVPSDGEWLRVSFQAKSTVTMELLPKSSSVVVSAAQFKIAFATFEDDLRRAELINISPVFGTTLAGDGGSWVDLTLDPSGERVQLELFQGDAQLGACHELPFIQLADSAELL